MLLDRRGQVEHVLLGDARRIYLPDIGRQRAGGGRLRGLRHVHTRLPDPRRRSARPLPEEDLSDLELLRLDYVAAVEVLPDGAPGQIRWAHLLPPAPAGSAPASRPADRAPLDGEIEPAGAPRPGEGQRWQEHTAASPAALALDALSYILELEAQLRTSLPDRQPGPPGRDRAILVHVTTRGREAAAASLRELRELAATAGLPVVAEVIQSRRALDPRFVVGRGKLEEIVLQALARGAEMLVIDGNLSPSQVRSIADQTDLKVIDRAQLILDIFARRATTRDGKLQVELAQLRYNLPRLSEMHTAMSRLTGGIGGVGPGETKLEINRRRAKERITALEREIDKIAQQRELRRRSRKRHGVPVVSIVGYTNAGKSTLLNLITGSDVLAEDRLFATLDPASRRVRFPRDREVIVTDTVGFIRDLPLDLIQAFRATLEELHEAQLLLHLIDAADPERADKAQAVADTLASLALEHIPVVTVYNKADRIAPGEAASLQAQGAFVISAATRQGVPELLAAIASRLD